MAETNYPNNYDNIEVSDSRIKTRNAEISNFSTDKEPTQYTITAEDFKTLVATIYAIEQYLGTNKWGVAVSDISDMVKTIQNTLEAHNHGEQEETKINLDNGVSVVGKLPVGYIEDIYTQKIKMSESDPGSLFVKLGEIEEAIKSLSPRSDGYTYVTKINTTSEYSYAVSSTSYNDTVLDVNDGMGKGSNEKYYREIGINTKGIISRKYIDEMRYGDYSLDLRLNALRLNALEVDNFTNLPISVSIESNGIVTRKKISAEGFPRNKYVTVSIPFTHEANGDLNNKSLNILIEVTDFPSENIIFDYIRIIPISIAKYDILDSNTDN